jgi:hypothetical protein
VSKSIKSIILAGVVAVGALPSLSLGADAMATPMTCQQMMDKATPMMSQMSDQKMMGMAKKEMDSAKMAMDKGHMKTCMSHMDKAMGMMKK